MLLVMSVMVVSAQEPTSTDTKKAPADVSAPAVTAPAMNLADLPKAVTESIAKEYPGYIIKEAMKAKEGSGADYKVVVSKGTATETLLYDKNGKFVKKDEMKSETHDPAKHDTEKK